MLRSQSCISFFIAVSALAGAAGATLAHAAPPPALEEVVVTATLLETPVRDLPASATVLAAQQLRDGAVTHLEDLLPLVPSLSWAGASSRPRFFQLRGIGELEQYQGAPNPSVGFLVDGMDFSGIGMIASLFDVEQVEVLRGPQGLHYGANALAGLIKVSTREPGTARSLDAEAGAGSDGLWFGGVAAGGALAAAGEDSAWRAVLHRATSNGFRRNAFLGRDDTNGRDELTARLRLRLAGAGRWRADLSLLHADFDNGYDAFAIDNSLRTLSDRPGRDSQRSTGASLDLVREGDGGAPRLRAQTAWAQSDIEASFDGDWGNDRDWGAAGPYDFFSRTLRERRTLSQDLQLASAGDGRASWLAGAYLLRLEEQNRIDDDGRYLDDRFDRLLASDYEATSVALYGRAGWQWTEATSVALGVRAEQRDAEYSDSDGSRFAPRDRMWGGQLSLVRELAGDARLWASLSRGYKAGGFNIGSVVPEERREFDPEYLWSAELGWRRGAEAHGMAADLSLFYMRRERQQVATSFQLDPQDPLTFVFLTDNAARGEAWGAEAAATWQATERLEFSAALSLMDSRYLGYRFGDRDLSGRDWAHAPDWKVAAAATWRHPAGWMARLDLSGEDGFFHDNSHDQRAGTRFLAHLRAGYAAQRWSVEAWVRNLSDRRYPVRGFYFGNEPPDFPERLYVRWGDPRQAGVTLRYAF